MFGPNLSDTYVLAVTKNLGWSVVIGRALQTISLLLVRSPWYEQQYLKSSSPLILEEF